MFESVFSLLSSRQDGIAPKGSPSGNESSDGGAFRAVYDHRDTAETTRDPATNDAPTFLFGVAQPADTAYAQPIVSELNTTITAQAGAVPAEQHRLAVVEAHDLIGGQDGQTLQATADARAPTLTLSQPTSLQSPSSLTGVDQRLDTVPAFATRTLSSAIAASPGSEANTGTIDALPDTIETIQVANPKHATPQSSFTSTEPALRMPTVQSNATLSTAAAPSSAKTAGEPGLVSPVSAKNMRAQAELETAQSASDNPAPKSTNSAPAPDTVAASAKPEPLQTAQTADDAIIGPQSEQRNQGQPSETLNNGLATRPTATPANSGEAPSKRARSTATPETALPASPASINQAPPLSLDPISDLVTAVQDASTDPASPAATLGSTTSSNAPLNLTSTTAPSFNPAAPSGQSPVIVASPADVPGVVAQTLAQNESTERISIQLDPPELGRVSIEFQIDESGVHTVTVTGETSEALRKLRLMNFELLQALEQQGLGGRSFSLEYQHSEPAEHWAQASDDPTGDGDDTQSQAATPNWPEETLQATRLSDPSQLGESGLNLRL